MTADPLTELFIHFPALETRRLRLRPLDEDDAEDLFSLFSDDEVTRFYDLETFEELVEAFELIDYLGESYATERQVRWGIEHRAESRVIGTCGFVWLRTYSAEIGYDLAQAYWGEGYMFEALDALLSYAFDVLALNRIEALVLPGNIRSQRLLARLGFVHEGTLREYDRFKGRFHDMEMHALLARDFAPPRHDRE